MNGHERHLIVQQIDALIAILLAPMTKIQAQHVLDQWEALCLTRGWVTGSEPTAPAPVRVVASECERVDALVGCLSERMPPDELRAALEEYAGICRERGWPCPPLQPPPGD